MLIYVVQAGDSLFEIAARFRLSQERIIADNGIEEPNRLAVGQALLLRFPDEVYTVQPNDTLSSIAENANTTVLQLLRNNPVLEGTTELIPGEELVIRYRDEEKLDSFYVNGYTYPSISNDILRATLPYLSYLTSFSYGFQPDGSLIAPDDSRVLSIAKDYSAAPVLLLSTLREDGSFSSEKANLLLQSVSAQDALFSSLQTALKERGFIGVDVDFEYIDPSLREAYATFIRRLRDSLAPEGYLVFVSLAPKTSADQQGILYEAHDYRLLGQAADRLLLMTYEWGYRFSEPMAVAPINRVREVVSYAVREIEPQKIFLGIPNYGYDWQLPYIDGETEARSISNTEAIALAARYGAEIRFDESAQSPYFRYRAEDGTEHEVWFEDVRSIRAKSALANEYGLGGVSVWNMMRYYPGLWSMLDAEYRILPGKNGQSNP